MRSAGWWPEALNGRRVESVYDCCGNRLEWSIGERPVACAYDPLGALAEIAIGTHAPLRFSRDANGRETIRESAAGYDSVDPKDRHPFNHGKCCEADAFSKYLNIKGSIIYLTRRRLYAAADLRLSAQMG